MGQFDDSALLKHEAPYNPDKAREYYLRTRKLKGRRPTTATPTSAGRGGRRPTTAVKSRDKTKSRQEELKAQKAALEKRLDRLRDVLKELVDAAQSRSGIDQPEKKKAAKDAAAKTSKAGSGKSDKDLTTSQKREKAQKAKKEYDKDHGATLTQDVEALKKKVTEIRAKIEKALDDAREQAKKSAPAGEKTTPNGPRGR